MPASSREKRWTTPSTSTRWSVSWIDDRIECEAASGAPSIASRLRARPRDSERTTARESSKRDGEARAGRSRGTVTRYGVAPWRSSITWPPSPSPSTIGRPRLAQARKRRRRTRSLSADASSAAATRAMSAFRLVRCSSAAVSRSSQPVSTVPSRTTGWSSRPSRNDLFVVPPRTTTTVWLSARCRRPSASSRSRPVAMTLAIIESNSGGITSPSATPVSTRIPGPAGSTSVSMVPGAGAKPRSGSSALSRASIAYPVVEAVLGASPDSASPLATRICNLTRSRPFVCSVIGCSTWRRVLTSRKEKRRSAGWYRNSTVPALVYSARRASRTADAAEVGVLFGRERQAVRLLDHLLVAPLQAAVAHADRPHRAVVVADDLHLDVAGVGDHPLHEHRRIAERLGALGAGTGERLGEAVRTRRRGGCRGRRHRPWPSPSAGSRCVRRPRRPR